MSVRNPGHVLCFLAPDNFLHWIMWTNKISERLMFSSRLSKKTPPKSWKLWSRNVKLPQKTSRPTSATASPRERVQHFLLSALHSKGLKIPNMP